ncbi:hypothetical protein ACP93_02465 [Xanthomonas sp. NCPPB 1128]|uniref:hypothetical protein n=1 Tax=Xanthomonas sp. NCPPB 1128 TaxID=1775876 RepID=UPI00065A9636|nr:hypothetical protein [Xanthomonas sp. NCPPB 1128]KMM77048.1 hypothetical protein ACP93_02200 [Xanthomonas sp. NCPPB 1128]KMM77092.1 hypothetical protein ACP93_02465 [Xanthomonas sp. NCPPB 1128]
MLRTCTHCARRLPETQFNWAGGKRRGACRLCDNDVQRTRAPLAPVRIDPVQVRLNNLACLWFGPARRETLRNAA